MVSSALVLISTPLPNFVIAVPISLHHQAVVSAIVSVFVGEENSLHGQTMFLRAFSLVLIPPSHLSSRESKVHGKLNMSDPRYSEMAGETEKTIFKSTWVTKIYLRKWFFCISQ